MPYALHSIPYIPIPYTFLTPLLPTTLVKTHATESVTDKVKGSQPLFVGRENEFNIIQKAITPQLNPSPFTLHPAPFTLNP